MIYYIGKNPFFEVFVSQGSKKNIPSEKLNLDNLHIIAEKGFLKTAKKNAVGKYILVISKDCKVDDRIFRFLVRFNKVPDVLKRMFFTVLYRVADRKISARNR